MRLERENNKRKCRYLAWNDSRSRLIGGATVDDSSQPVLLEKIDVRRNMRGNGIGSEILREILSDYGDSEIVARVFSSRLDWYRRHGFDLEEESGDLVRVRRSPE